MKYIKSIVATIMGLVTPLAALAAANGGVLTSADIKAALATAVLSGGAVLVAPKNATSTVAGLVVTVKTDAARFLAVFTAGLPTLLEQAAQAAITSTQPVVALAPVDPATPTPPAV